MFIANSLSGTIPIIVDVVFTALMDLGEHLRFADLIDIAVVTGFFYAVIVLFQQSISRRVTRSVLGLSAVFLVIYILARLSGLFLVELVVEVLFFVLIVGVILIFQEDLRRVIDRLGGWRIFGRSRPDETSGATIDILTETAEKLAEKRTGALIALKGKEAWERLIHGGIDLSGEVSQPLLMSLFNPTSPAHDGAVLLEGHRILAFGVHLPLSTRLSGESEHGTRHAAGLGLSERCDALVIVVSEERGEVSVAEDGALTVLDSASELKSRLQQFWEDRYVSHRDKTSRDWNLRRVSTGFVSAVLAASLWLLFIYDPHTGYRPVEAPIAFENLPSDWHVEQPVPGRATVFLSGSRRAFDGLTPDEVVISIDLQTPREGPNNRTLTADDVRRPRGLGVYQIEPQEVTFTARKMQVLRAPVRADTTGRLPAALELTDLRVEPDSVTVLVADGGSDSPPVVFTEPVDLSQLSKSTTLTRSVTLPENVHLSGDQPSEVAVHVDVNSAADR